MGTYCLMNVPVTLIGSGIVVAARTIVGLLRAKHLIHASEKISINPSDQIILKYAKWYYIYPVLGLCGSVLMGWAASQSPFPKAVAIYKIACGLCLLGGLWLLYRQL